MEADVVGLGKQGGELLETHLHLLGPLSRDEGVVGHHVHAHRLGDTGDVGADLAQADHTQLFLVELVADVFLAVPAASHGAAMGVGDVPGERQHQGQCMLSRRDRVPLRGIHDNHAALGGRRHVHVVDADASPADDPQLGGRLNDVGGHRGAGADHQGVVVANDRLQLFRWQARSHIHLSHLGQDVDPCLIDGIGYQNLRHDPAGWSGRR